jgi:hypothetical protein
VCSPKLALAYCLPGGHPHGSVADRLLMDLGNQVHDLFLTRRLLGGNGIDKLMMHYFMALN